MLHNVNFLINVFIAKILFVSFWPFFLYLALFMYILAFFCTKYITSLRNDKNIYILFISIFNAFVLPFFYCVFLRFLFGVRMRRMRIVTKRRRSMLGRRRRRPCGGRRPPRRRWRRRRSSSANTYRLRVHRSSKN